MNKFKNKKISLIKGVSYISLSVFLHMALLFNNYKKSVFVGDKLIPVEILNIEPIASKGEYFLEFEKQALNNIKKNISDEKPIDNKDQINELVEEKIEKFLQLSTIKDEIKNNSTDKYLKINKPIGTSGEINQNELEKGSLKGLGVEKITCLSCVKPEYPKLALRRGYEGILKLKVLIAKNGDVINVKIIKSTGYKVLDKSGIEAAKKSKFYPLKKERTLNLEYILKLNS
tara:strand:- start:956 stop:1645 length:690 start_codon:yes stop_codon:yes gene_type:complete